MIEIFHTLRVYARASTLGNLLIGFVDLGDLFMHFGWEANPQNRVHKRLGFFVFFYWFEGRNIRDSNFETS